MSIVYSIFSFFIGYYLYDYQYNFFKKIKVALYGYAMACFAVPMPGLIDRNAFAFWFSLFQKNIGIISIISLIALNVLYTMAYTSLTVVMILSCVLFVILIRHYILFKISIIGGILMFALFFISLFPYLKLYSLNTINLFGNLELVYSQHPFFNIDHNSSWRLVFWYRVLVERFPENIFGIGLGTPLISYMPGQTTSDLANTDEYIAHVIGVHNTYITLFVRFGIVFLFILLFIYRSVFREFYKYKNYYLKHRNDISLFLGFITITIVGLFNLLLETPTLASVFWVLLGFVAKAIYNRQQQSYEVQNL